ncbi:MAG: hypothetical protein FIA82_04710 [Melioribacter sp.]|nr:hypothetical protein [Melioribacter sp.]
MFLFVAFIFAFNSFGFIFHFLIEREYAKEEAFEKIVLLKSKEKIEVLSISKSVINEGKVFQRINKKEIRYEGKMYDIVKEEKQTDKIIFYCVHDEKEDKLEKRFSKTVNKNLNQKAITGSSISFNHLIQYAEYGINRKNDSPISKVKYSNYSNCNYNLSIPKILTPPPKYSLI